MSACRSCGAEILWAYTKNGKRIPLDLEPREDGNLEIVGHANTEFGDEGPEAPIVRTLLKGEDQTLPGLEVPARYVSHFATCPDAAQHRSAA